MVSATLAPIALIGGWTVAGARQPSGYGAVSDTISALASAEATDSWIMTVGFAVLGTCHVVTALGLLEARPAGRWVLGLGGATALLVATFPQPSPVHVPAATVSFVALALWPALSGVPNRVAGWAATGVLTGMLTWFALELGEDRVGLAERGVAAAQVLWPLATVWAVLLRSRVTCRGAGRRVGPS